MSTPAVRRTQGIAAPGAQSSSMEKPSLDGTSFALDGASLLRVRERFPGERVSTRRIFIAHDTHEAFA